MLFFRSLYLWHMALPMCTATGTRADEHMRFMYFDAGLAYSNAQSAKCVAYGTGLCADTRAANRSIMQIIEPFKFSAHRSRGVCYTNQSRTIIRYFDFVCIFTIRVICYYILYDSIQSVWIQTVHCLQSKYQSTVSFLESNNITIVIYWYLYSQKFNIVTILIVYVIDKHIIIIFIIWLQYIFDCSGPSINRPRDQWELNSMFIQRRYGCLYDTKEL